MKKTVRARARTGQVRFCDNSNSLFTAAFEVGDKVTEPSFEFCGVRTILVLALGCQRIAILRIQ